MSDHNARTVAVSLDRMADVLRTRADELMEFSALIDDEQDYSGSVLNENVSRLVMAAFNTSSLVAPAQTAISAANRCVEG